MAQLDKAPAYEVGDCRFESCRVRQIQIKEATMEQPINSTSNPTEDQRIGFMAGEIDVPDDFDTMENEPCDPSPDMHQQAMAYLTKRCWDTPLMPTAYRRAYVEATMLQILGIDDWMHAESWATFDLMRRKDGVRVKVQDEAIVKAWHRIEPPRGEGVLPAFSIVPNSAGRQPDLHIFAMHNVADIDVADHRDRSQWDFHVVSENDLRERFADQKVITLRILSGFRKPVGSDELYKEVESILPLWSI